MLGRDFTTHDARDHCENPSGRHIYGPSSRILPTLPEPCLPAIYYLPCNFLLWGILLQFWSATISPFIIGLLFTSFGCLLTVVASHFLAVLGYSFCFFSQNVLVAVLVATLAIFFIDLVIFLALVQVDFLGSPFPIAHK